MTRRARTRAEFAALTHLTQAEAAVELGMTPGGVSVAARRFGLTFKSAKAERAAMNRARYEAVAHLPPAQAAAELGVSAAAVSQAAVRYGITFGASRQPPPAAARPPAPTVPRVVPDGRPPRPARPAACAKGAMMAAPAFDADRDALILQSKGRYPKLHALALEWKMPAARVIARWHVLRHAPPTQSGAQPRSVARSDARKGAAR